jgi:hypothetical protein
MVALFSFYLFITFILWLLTIFAILSDGLGFLEAIYIVPNRWIILFGLLFPIAIPVLFFISVVVKLIREY